jgi:fatty-acyl-CoA synthase
MTLVPLLENCAAAGNSRVLCIANASDFKTTLQNTHYEDLLAEQSDEYEYLSENDACGCVTKRHNRFAKGFCIPIALLIYMLPIISPNAGNFSNEDTLLLIVPQFHVMAGVSLPMFTIWF